MVVDLMAAAAWQYLLSLGVGEVMAVSVLKAVPLLYMESPPRL